MSKQHWAWAIAAVVAILIVSGLATGAIQGWVRDLSDLATEQSQPVPPQQ